ncbi:MAG: glutathione S-transferase [Rhizobiales bacterium 65-9]|nr:glutathione S-transferase family protein [Rhodospirillales bacterium]MBN9064821.1 glutathione S-transferase family protein [Hyphomicrobiales bacterium]OJY35551.1 MAG: glutathione S-transferase [Rhizobiales bacterium 65-9]
MIKLYGVARSRASRNIWMLKEIGLDFELVPVIQVYRLPDPNAANAPLHTRSKAFLDINPNARVPALDDDGFVMTESLAINLYLARRYGGDLGPRDAQEDGLMTMWSLWAATECEQRALEILSNRVSNPAGELDEGKAQAAVAALRAPFKVLDQALAETGHVVGDRFTAADINLAEVLRYAQPAPELFHAAPNVRAWIEACQSRPAYHAMAAMRAAEPA